MYLYTHIRICAYTEPGDRSTPEGLHYAADVAAFYSKARGNVSSVMKVTYSYV
jgi:hypothetical protein